MDKKEVNQLSPLTLAFLGDAVYEQLVRESLVLNANMPAGKLHDLKIKKVCCSYQSSAIDLILQYLSEDEIAIYKRGRNANGNTIPRNADACEYRRATGLECLFGYLHLRGKRERLMELFKIIWDSDKEN